MGLRRHDSLCLAQNNLIIPPPDHDYYLQSQTDESQVDFFHKIHWGKNFKGKKKKYKVVKEHGKTNCAVLISVNVPVNAMV